MEILFVPTNKQECKIVKCAADGTCVKCLHGCECSKCPKGWLKWVIIKKKVIPVLIVIFIKSEILDWVVFKVS